MSAAELFEVGIDEAVNVAVHNRLNISGFIAGAVVFNKGVGHENIGADLAAPCDFFLYALDVLDFLKMLAFLDFNKLGAEHIHTNLAVLVLRTLDLRAYNNSGGNMGKTNGGGGLVYLLTARAGGTVNVHFDVLFPDFYGFVILDFRHNLKGGKGGVAAAGGVKSDLRKP